jgi:hypothetical protein
MPVNRARETTLVTMPPKHRKPLHIVYRTNMNGMRPEVEHNLTL